VSGHEGFAASQLSFIQRVGSRGHKQLIEILKVFGGRD
jgi:hypothetical protein